jgi:putative transposase
VIVIEDLNVSGLMKNHKLAGAIADVSWSGFVSKLEYKAEWYGRSLVRVGRFFPSTKTCSVCGHVDGKKPLDIREWVCPVCGAMHDRDVNAAVVSKKEGLRIYNEYLEENRRTDEDSLVKKRNRCMPDSSLLQVSFVPKKPPLQGFA